LPICLALILVALSPQLNLQPEVKGPELVEVSLTELIEQPALYNNKRVRVRGEYVTAFEKMALDISDPVTHNPVVSIWIDYEDDHNVAKEYRNFSMDDFMNAVRSGVFKKGEPDLPWLIPSPVKPVPPQQLKAIQKAMNKRRGRSIYVIIDGRFDYRPGGRLLCSPDGKISWTPGFGHMGRYEYRIVVESIRRIKKRQARPSIDRKQDSNK
jgi:hypothetical protein